MERIYEKEVCQSTAMEYRKRVCTAMNYISENIEKDLSLEEIAGVAYFSMFHFHRIFKAVVGETISEFTRRLRLELAANRLISKRNQDITTIAIRSGFSSSQNFAKAFRQHFGMTPSYYRKSKIGNKSRKKGNAISLQTEYNMNVQYMNYFNNERIQAMKAQIKEMPEYHVAYIRKIGKYGKDTCEQAFGELMQWASPRGHLNSGTILAVYWDSPEITPAEKCRVDACVTVPKDIPVDDPIALQTISGGLYATCHFEVQEPDFRQAWEDTFHWLVAQGYECADKPCYEIYYNKPEEQPPQKFIFDICVPLKRK